jgi:hypothetical protein
MITVTERAATGLEELLVAQGAAPGEAVKLVPSGRGGVALTIASPAAGDEVVRRGDDPLLIVDGRLAPIVDGALLDLAAAAPAGGALPRFTLTPPEQG